MKPKLALDIEGTTIDLHTAVAEYINETYRDALIRLEIYPLLVEDMTEWGWGGKMKKLGLTNKEISELCDKLWCEKSFAMPPTEKDLPGKIAKLTEMYEVDIVTGRNELENIRALLNKYGILSYERMISEKQKERLGYFVYVDDDPTLCDRISSNQVQLLYRRPWNRCVKPRPNIIPVENFDDVLCEAKNLLNMLKSFEHGKRTL
ncbi:MAG: hypothetical protein QXH80_04350 [Candidatus Nanoarchaeia archaeon]